jgi:hypothetical protein
MTEEQIKIRLDSSTYVTKVNGRLVMVRERREKLLDICMDLLGEAFGKYSRPKMRDDSKKPEGENVPVQNPRTTPFQNFPTPPVFNPNANLVGSPPVQAIMGPMGPQPGIYRFGNRQLALLPLNPQGGSAMSPQMGYPYPQPPWMFPQTSNKGSFNFPPMGTDPRQFITNPAPLSEVASQTSVTVTKHVCAECGRLRSRKYQHENPLRPGESPTPSFCKKCQRDVTSTEESDTSVRKTEKSHMRSKKGRKVGSTCQPVVYLSLKFLLPIHHANLFVDQKEIRSESDTESSRESIGSNERQKALSSKVRTQIGYQISAFS